jgi:hypothetical protein
VKIQTCQMPENILPRIKATHCSECVSICRVAGDMRRGLKTICWASYLLQAVWRSLPPFIIALKSGVSGSGLRIMICTVSIPRIFCKINNLVNTQRRPFPSPGRIFQGKCAPVPRMTKSAYSSASSGEKRWMCAAHSHWYIQGIQ